MFLLVFCDRKYFRANSKINAAKSSLKKKWRRLFTFCTSGNTNKRQIQIKFHVIEKIYLKKKIKFN